VEFGKVAHIPRYKRSGWNSSNYDDASHYLKFKNGISISFQDKSDGGLDLSKSLILILYDLSLAKKEAKS
jgi:hypothetical protein